MNASELAVGLEVAVVAGTASWDLRTKKATRAEVLKEPRRGRVEVKLLEESNSSVGAHGAAFSRTQGQADETVRISTRQCWMPWETLERRAENERTARETTEAEDAAREEKLSGLQHRLDQFAGEVDQQIAWGGYQHRFDYTATVTMPTVALEKLLDRAEGK